MNDNVRILKGYTKEERKELEDAKEFENLGDYLSTIIKCQNELAPGYIWKKYSNSTFYITQTLIIKDIVDFYCGEAKFADQKYYVELPSLDYPYLVKKGFKKLDLNRCLDNLYQHYFTEDEIKAIDPRYMAFAVPVEDDDE